MAVYTTKADFITRFGDKEVAQLTSRKGAASATVVDAVLDRALQDGGDEIDKHIGAVYQLPVPAASHAVLRRINADISRFYLYDDKAPALVRQRYEDAIANLRRMADGKAVLDGATAKTNVVLDRVSTGVRSAAPARQFTDEALGRMVTE